MGDLWLFRAQTKAVPQSNQLEDCGSCYIIVVQRLLSSHMVHSSVLERCTYMSEQELAEFRQRVLESRFSRTASREVARQLLVKEGVITPEGELTERYGGKQSAA